MQRYFISPEQFGEDSVTLAGEDAHHIIRVMRSKPKDQFIVSDGKQREAIVEIVSMGIDEVTATVVEILSLTGEPWVQVSVAQSLPKGDKMETVIQKCTEIGAVSFVPFLSERTIVQYDGKKEEKRLIRWNKIAKEAAEQAHRSMIPSVGAPLRWKQLLSSFAEYELVLICYEKENGQHLRQALAPFARKMEKDQTYRMLVIVGPEGGLTEREVEEAEAAGAVSIGLGRRILRTETAAMAALTCIMYETGEMGVV